MTRHLHRKGFRGQAVLELALGTLVFVTVLVFGIYFAEVGYLSLKIQEASTSALWDTTGRKMHDMANLDFSPRLSAITTAGGMARTRYRNFDGRTSQLPRSPGITQLFTRGTRMQVTCAQAGIASMAQPDKLVYADTGGMECYAEAQVSAFKFPKRFLDQANGFFRQRHASPTINGMRICSTGRANPMTRNCDARFSVLLDDWGLTGSAEGTQCDLESSPCTNQGFYKLVNRVYGGGAANGASVTMASQLVGAAPINPAMFWTSLPAPGTEADPTTPYGDASPNPWHTNVGPSSRNGMYASLAGLRGGCFLGLTCPPP